MKKIVIISGSTGNLGAAVVNKFADTGYIVIGTVRADTPSNNANVIYKPLNALDSTAAKAFVDHVLEEYGRIDALVCLIGGFGMASIGSTSKDEIDKMINLNFYSAFNLVQPYLEAATEGEEPGNVVLVGAKPALEPSAAVDLFPYALSKSMVIKLAETINADTDKSKVKASVIIPSIIDTPVNRESMPDAKYSDWVTPESIAEKIAFICSKQGRDLRDTIFKIYGSV